MHPNIGNVVTLWLLQVRCVAGRQEDMMGQDDGAGEEDKKRSIKMHIVDILSAGRVLMSHWSSLSESAQNSFLLTPAAACSRGPATSGLGSRSLPRFGKGGIVPVLDILSSCSSSCLAEVRSCFSPSNSAEGYKFRSCSWKKIECNEMGFFKRWLNRVLSWNQISWGFRFCKKCEESTNQLTSRF